MPTSNQAILGIAMEAAETKWKAEQRSSYQGRGIDSSRVTWNRATRYDRATRIQAELHELGYHITNVPKRTGEQATVSDV